MDVTIVSDKEQWNRLVESFGGHPLQQWQWGDLKQQTGPWTSHHVMVSDASGAVGGAQILVRKMPFPVNAIAYAPRGPFAKDGMLMQVADELAAWVKGNTKAQSLKVDPAVTELDWSAGWEPSEAVLISKTAALDLTRDEDEIMKGIPNRKCRQYIRKGERDGVVVRPGTEADLDAVLALYHATADADGFIQAFLWNVTSKGGTTFELWGAVNDAGKRSRANYYQKWVAILAAKQAGARLYDLNGLLNDGISDFKLLFVPEATNWVATHDRPLGAMYRVMNKALELHRSYNERNNAQADTSRSK